MTEAEKYLLSLGDRILETVLITCVDNHKYARVVQLTYKEKIGFFIYTNANSNKVSQIKKNPYVTLSIESVDNMYNEVAHCVARVSDDKKEIYSVYTDAVKNFGFSGKDDPSLCIIFFTVQSVVHGTKVYQGAKINYDSFPADRNYDVPKLPEGDFKEKEAKDAVKKAIGIFPNAHAITSNGLLLEDRMMYTDFKDELGFYSVTTATTKKIIEIESDPSVCLLYYDKKTMDQVIVDAVCIIDRSQESKNLAWKESFTGYGYEKAGNTWVVLRYELRSVNVQHEHTSVVYVCPPPKYDKDVVIAIKAAKTKLPIFLTTVTKEGYPKTRMMERLNYHPLLGFYNVTSDTNKTKQIKDNKHVLLISYSSETYDDYEIEADACVVKNNLMNHAVYLDYYNKFELNGPDDENVVIVRYKVTNAKELNAKAIIDMCH